MTPWLEFTVPGSPRPKERPRFNTRTHHTYTPRDTAGAELVVGWAAKAAMVGKQVVTCPVEVGIDFYTATARRGDLDNLTKLVLDALNELVWDDDSQIVKLTLTRQVDRVSPRTDVRVWLAEAQEAA